MCVCPTWWKPLKSRAYATKRPASGSFMVHSCGTIQVRCLEWKIWVEQICLQKTAPKQHPCICLPVIRTRWPAYDAADGVTCKRAEGNAFYQVRIATSPFPPGSRLCAYYRMLEEWVDGNCHRSTNGRHNSHTIAFHVADSSKPEKLRAI